jgi:fructokinase
MAWYGAVELGGTKARVAVGDGSHTLLRHATFTTGEHPTALVAELARWFRSGDEPLDAVGVASFGPLDLVEGRIGATPKRGWEDFPLRRALVNELGLPVVVDTDVNGALLAETTWGVAQGCTDALYVTVGTGIGVGALVSGRVVHGRSHPEMGHMRIPRDADDRWSGDCAFHGGCWEGVASGHALAARCGVAPEALEDKEAWRREIRYLAAGIANLICIFRAERVVIGGGVARRQGLLEEVRRGVADLLNPSYFPEAADLDRLLVAPGLGDLSGLFGGILLARRGARRYIAIVGPASAASAGLAPGAFERLCGVAFELGRLVTSRGGVVVTGGLGGVMEAASAGARSVDGKTVGFTPGVARGEGNAFLEFELPTGMGEARNALIVRCADALIAVGGSWGTLSELALARRADKPVVCVEGWRLVTGETGDDELHDGWEVALDAKDAVDRAFRSLGWRD